MPRRPAQLTRMQPFVAVSKPLSSNLKKRKADFSTAEDELPLNFSVVASTKKRRLGVNTPPETPTKTIKHSLAALNINTPASNLKRKRDASPDIAIVITPPASRATSIDADLPAELEDLKRLNAAFLSALTLHYAHNGNSTSADLRMLTPSVTKTWGKRKVTVQDIRLLVTIIHSTTTSRNGSVAAKFCMKDYGEGKVCVEFIRQRRGRGAITHSFNESHINVTFGTNLEIAWESWNSHPDNRDAAVKVFIDSIELEPLTTSATLAKIAPLRAKGQHRLEEVLTPFQNFNLSDETASRPIKRARSGPGRDTQTEPEKENVKPTKEEAKPINPLDRSLSLLDRIKAKEAHAASLPAAPTKEARERIAALQRSEELLEVLNLLALAKGGASRISFPLPSLVSSIQSSLRNPLSKDEIVRAVKVLQTEVAPKHVSMVTFGAVTGVVLDRSRKPSLADVKAKLKALGI